ncbi:MAG: hypothetical protein LBP23_01615 [Treponema sp.]|jgi:hypothetical protein|nr:hypothetical protein [Treponema sp.]
MNRKRRPFPAKAVFFSILGMAVPVLLSAQALPAENNWGLDDEGKAIVAVLPLAGDETEMIQRFQKGIMDSVAALQKYRPREVRASAVAGAEPEIPTDMPPVRGLTNGARYALTGGVYPGSRTGEYYLQLWLWDMAGSTMIYTDDLVYDDMDGAMESLPGLVEWLFSHIREAIVKEPEAGVRPDPLFTLGLRFGPSHRWYVGPGEVSPGASATNLEGGVSGAVRINSLFSFQLELLMTGDALVYRGLTLDGNQYFLANKKYTNLSLAIPFLCKVNLWAGPVRLSPLAGFYLTAPLGRTRYRYSMGGGERSWSWSFSVPMGFTAGLEGAVQYGPGRIFAGLRYAGDFGDVVIRSNPETTYRRHAFSLYLGYEFGFLDRKKLGEFLGEFL